MPATTATVQDEGAFTPSCAAKASGWATIAALFNLKQIGSWRRLRWPPIIRFTSPLARSRQNGVGFGLALVMYTRRTRTGA